VARKGQGHAWAKDLRAPLSPGTTRRKTLDTQLVVKIRRTTAGELLIGIIEPALGIRKEETVWLGKSQLISRFGIEGSQILVKKAQEGER
jgi:hypothetical protein